MARKKDPAAVSLGKKRWKGSTEKEREEHARMMGEARTGKLSPGRRKEIAQKAAAARWGKKR